MSNTILKILCITSYYKGVDFIREVKAAGHQVFLLTDTKLKHEDWPWESLDDTFYIDLDDKGEWNMQHVINGLAYKMRSIKFDRFIALDDFDVERVAHLREFFRIPGMGETTSRYFRDKLAMRIKAQEAGIPVPAFVGLFNDVDINTFTDWVPTPWLIKPRSAASATGIKKIYSKEQLWEILGQLGDERPQYLLEQFAPGDVFHADALTVEGKVEFCRISQYLDTPFDVAHGGGIFRSHTVALDSKDDKQLQKLNAKVMKAFGMQYSASHTEFIKGKEDGKYYFLETSSRVGGANLAEMVEAATGLNLWRAWARMEIAKALGLPYEVPKTEKGYAGIVVSLSRYQHPDHSTFFDDELWWRMKKDWHIGLIVKSPQRERVLTLLEKYTARIAQEFHASLPAPDRPTS